METLNSSINGLEVNLNNLSVDSHEECDASYVAEILKGIEEEQFEVWFQPQVNHANAGMLIGAEVLVRWRHPEKGVIYPDAFIPFSEKHGLIYELDKYVWRKACKCLRAWMDEGLTYLPLSVNVSRLDILQPDFIDTICSILVESGISSDLLHLEITESAFSDESDRVADVVSELIDRGFIIAIDDFGSGYSSLSLLQNVTANIAKLDMRFFTDGKSQSRNECIVESIIRMVRMLGMAVVAEGVEDGAQADTLRTLGCVYIQGYLYSKPLPKEEYEVYIKSRSSESIDYSGTSVNEDLDPEYAYSQRLFHTIVYGTDDVIFVVDKESKKLLYVNRAAEHYFKKRFDPLYPVVCSEFCNRLSQCNNCPVCNIEPGARHEAVVEENGKYLRTMYTQMDWNGHDAVVYYQNDITREMQAFEFSNALIRGIPGTTIAFEMKKDNHPRVFYVSMNALDVFKLAGINKEKPGFEDCLRIMHKEDRKRIRVAAARTFQSKVSFHESFRIVLKSGEIRWGELMVNPVEDGTGNYLFYGIYNDINSQKQYETNSSGELNNVQEIINIALSEAVQLPTPSLGIEYIIGFIGHVLHSERVYVFEKNPDGTDSNTFEWVADGITPEKNNLQNVSAEISQPWYEKFKQQNIVIIEDLEEIKEAQPELYEALAVQKIHSLVVAPMFNGYGVPMGFFGIDNPPSGVLKHNSKLVRTIAYFIEASLKSRDLEKTLDK